MPHPDTGEPVRVALLTGGMSASEREETLAALAQGDVDIAIGTHALIQRGVEFRDLAVAVVDEQHRFGVEQRAALRQKGAQPHMLVMSATPDPAVAGPDPLRRSGRLGDRRDAGGPHADPHEVADLAASASARTRSSGGRWPRDGRRSSSTRWSRNRQ